MLPDNCVLAHFVIGSVPKVPDEEKDAVRTAYLRRHPEAFWVCLLNIILFLK